MELNLEPKLLVVPVLGHFKELLESGRWGPGCKFVFKKHVMQYMGAVRKLNKHIIKEFKTPFSITVKHGVVQPSLDEIRTFLEASICLDLNFLNTQLKTACLPVMTDKMMIAEFDSAVGRFTTEWDTACQLSVVKAVESGVKSRVTIPTGFTNLSEGEELYACKCVCAFCPSI